MISQIKTDIVVTNNQIELELSNITVETKSQSPLELLFGQVISTPAIVNIGELSGEYIDYIQLWNASGSTININNISGVGTTGITLDGLQNGVINNNNILNYTLTVSTDGPKDIDGTFTYNFTESQFNTNLQVLGSRISTFDFDLNWESGKTPKEYYSHVTDIAVSYSGKEQRVNITEDPRLKIEYSYNFIGRERIKAENIIYNVGDQKILIPIHHQKTKLLAPVNIGDNTAEMYTEDNLMQIGTSIFVKEGLDKNTMKITNITGTTVTFENQFSKNFGLNAVATPVMLCYLNNNIAFNYKTNDIAECLLTFDIIDSHFNNITNNIDNYEEYDGLKLIVRKPTRNIDIKKTFERQFQTLDYTAGYRTRFSKDKTPAIIFNYNFALFGRQEIKETKALFNNLKGRFNEFYVNSTSNDLILADDIQLTEVAINIYDDGQISFDNNIIKSIIRIELKDGSVYIKKVLDYIPQVDQKLSLIIDSSFGVDISIDDVANIQYLSNARFNNDTLAIDHISDEYAEIAIDIKVLRNV